MITGTGYTNFTYGTKYLSVKRDDLQGSGTIVIGDTRFDKVMLRQNITYNEHTHVVRFNRRDYSKCRV